MRSSTTLAWYKSGSSCSAGSARLKIATRPTSIHIRNVKAPGGPLLTVTPDTRTAILSIPQKNRA